MKQQNYANHSRLVLGYHGVLFILILALLIGAIMNLINASDQNLYSASLLVLVSIILLLLMYYSRPLNSIFHHLNTPIFNMASNPRE